MYQRQTLGEEGWSLIRVQKVSLMQNRKLCVPHGNRNSYVLWVGRGSPVVHNLGKSWAPPWSFPTSTWSQDTSIQKRLPNQKVL